MKSKQFSPFGQAKAGTEPLDFKGTWICWHIHFKNSFGSYFHFASASKHADSTAAPWILSEVPNKKRRSAKILVMRGSINKSLEGMAFSPSAQLL